MTESMFLASKASDWAVLEKLEAERSATILHFFDKAEHHEDDLASIRNMIAAVLERDKEIMAICTSESEDCQARLAAFSQGRRAVAAYTTING